jgi:O-antigen ligase
VGVVAVGSITRGGLVAIMAAVFSVMMIEPSKVGKKLLLAGATALLVATVWLGWESTYVVPGKARAIHPAQVAKNLLSIAGGSQSGEDNLEGTREWRLLWWDKILDYTVHGQYFWTGKGFGVNLTYDDGIELDPENPSRNPHNGHLTILARSGVPGLVLWAALQLWFACLIVRGSFRAKRAGQQSRAALFAWVLAYWIAVLVDASFDPYLESPQGGIWFWCVFAYGVALLMTQDTAPRALTASRRSTWVLTGAGHV